MPANALLKKRSPRRRFSAQAFSKVLSALSLAGSRGAAMLAQVSVQIAVGALSGPVGLGILQLFTTWSNVLGEVLARGWPTMVLKRVSIAWGQGDRVSARTDLDQAKRKILRGWPLGLAAAILMVIAGSFFSPRIDGPEDVWLVPAILGSAFLFALMRIGAEALKGTDAALTAVTLENLALPSALLLLCMLCIFSGISLSPSLLVIGVLLGLMMGVVMLGRALGKRIGRSTVANPAPEVPADKKERHALWLSSVHAILFLQLPFLVMPLFTDTETIGIYSVAFKLINIITTLLILLASIFGPAFARAAADNDRQRLGSLLARTRMISLCLFGPAAIVLLLLDDTLARLFHVPLVELSMFMSIMVAGQLINAATGLSGVLLNLTGAARTEWRISFISLCIALFLSVPIGLSFGATGLAVLFSAVIAIKHIASWLAARRHLKKGVFTQ